MRRKLFRYETASIRRIAALRLPIVYHIIPQKRSPIQRTSLLKNHLKKQRRSKERRCVGIDLSSRSVSRQVLSALVSLTSVFGMGTGGPSPLKTPTLFRDCTLKTKQRRGSKVCPHSFCRSSPRAISTGWLNMLPCVHRRPINEVVFFGPYS